MQTETQPDQAKRLLDRILTASGLEIRILRHEADTSDPRTIRAKAYFELPQHGYLGTYSAGWGIVLQDKPTTEPAWGTFWNLSKQDQANVRRRPNTLWAREYIIQACNSYVPSKVDLFGSLLSDASCFDCYDSLDDFAAQLCEGMPISQTIKSFEACKEAARILRRQLGRQYDRAQRIAREL